MMQNYTKDTFFSCSYILDIFMSNYIIMDICNFLRCTDRSIIRVINYETHFPSILVWILLNFTKATHKDITICDLSHGTILVYPCKAYYLTAAILELITIYAEPVVNDYSVHTRLA